MTAKKIYMVGIGGIGMSALAQYLRDHGARVSGSDRSQSPTTDMLLKKSITVYLGEEGSHLPKDTELVVYSAAVYEDQIERVEAKKQRIPQLSYFEMLGNVSEGKRTVAVAGTHGKTTTTGMLARILADAGEAPTAVVGSIVKDFDSNYLAGTSDLFVVEACEYKRHFLNLAPEVLVITNIEFDHSDYYTNLADVQDAFRSMVARVPAHGTIVTDPSDPRIAPVLSAAVAPIVDYTKEPSYVLRAPGMFNIMNARAASAAALAVAPALDRAGIKKSLQDFHGSWRRFEYKGKTHSGADVYDDYAHHPTAIEKTLEALRDKVNGKIVVAFHPHLYSRTRDLLEEFAAAFVDADEVYVAPIFAAREIDDGTVSSALLAERIRENGTNAYAIDSLDALERILTQSSDTDTIMTMGAGDIYKVADAIAKRH